MKKSLIYCILILSFLVGCQQNEEQKQGTIVLQLRWEHQFQFAGYYAALWQGFYEEEGLDVEIRSALTDDKEILSAVEEVSAGNAHFGVGAADILKANDQGEALSVVASIFQQSAAQFYLKQETPFSSLADLTHLRVARNENGLIDLELQAMLLNEGIDPDSVFPYPHQPGLDHLLNDDVQVLPGYRTTIPYFRDNQGNEFKKITPLDYGVDFYGDSIFTTYDLTQEDPELVERFVRASIKGWEYALENSEEVAGEISETFERVDELDDLLDFNLFQAEVIYDLTHYPIVETGNINSYRWEKMHEFMKESGQVENNLDISQFIFDPKQILADRNALILKYIYWGLGSSVVLLVAGLVWAYTLRQQALQQLAIMQTEEKFQRVLNHSKDIIYQFDLQTGTYDYMSPSIEDAAGVTAEDYIRGGLELAASLIHPDDKEKLQDHIDHLLNKQLEDEFSPTVEYRFKHPELGWQWFSDNRVVVYDEDGNASEIVGTSRNINERKRAEEKIFLLNKELEQRVIERTKEIESFSYSVSHDLRAPLRAISGFSEILINDYAEEADHDMKDYLNKINLASHEMHDLITDLLSLSQLSRRKLSLISFSPDALAIQVFESLKKLEDKRTINFQALNCPQVIADQNLIKLLLTNLISNAMKFSREGEIMSIEFGSLEEKDGTVFYLRDNGIGFNMAYADKIFAPFQRLHSGSKYEGTGIGLAIAYRVIQNHKGKIWVESLEGEGSTIYFTLGSLADK